MILTPDVYLIVYGIPGPQGSKSYKGQSKLGHAILVESSKKVKPWRAAVQFAAAVCNNRCVTGPVCYEMTFTLPRPKAAKRGAVPHTRPDVSKLMRSTEDALTDAGVWEDDGRAVDARGIKRYPNEGVDALDRPGCVIKIWRI